MATQTLAEAKKLINNEIVAGVVQEIIDINPWFAALPFNGYTGQGLICNALTTLGDADFEGVGDDIGSKSPSAFTSRTYTATTLIGDVEMNGLVQAQSASAGVDQISTEIQSKARRIAQLFQQGIATGTGSSPVMNSMHYLAGNASWFNGAQYTTTSAGQAISFALLDELCDLVLAKDGLVDFIMMPARTMRAYKALLRALGGATGDWVVELPDGRTTIGYEGIPVFKNTFLSVAETANGAALTGGALASVWAGCFDDGTEKVGCAGIHPAGVPAGVMVDFVGPAEAKDNNIIRVKQYANFACFNAKGLARLTSINN